MRVLGIDPGTVIMGYGIVEAQGDNTSLIECGVMKKSERFPIGERLIYFYRELSRIISHCRPEAVAIEEPFVAKNVKSALAVGRAQAVAMLAAAASNIPTFAYTPTQVKQRVADYGTSSKEQVQQMVKLQLGLAEPPQPSDAADAVAVAICHVREMHLQSLLTRSEERR